MKPKFLLRIAALIMLLHAVGHTIGTSTWKDSGSKVPEPLIRQMTDTPISFMGATGTMAGYYDGMGYASTIAMLLVVYLLWIVSGFEDPHTHLPVKILWPVLFFLILWGIDEVIYFFPMAATFSFLAGLLTFLSILGIRKKSIS
jgi:hypothetical protein